MTHEALTPNHFLIGSSLGEFKLGVYDERKLCSKREWEIAQFLTDSFWDRWLKEYVPSLKPRLKWREKVESFSVDDLKLIVDLRAPRNTWRKGKVIELFVGKDSVIRTAKVATCTGDYVRPIHKLINLYDSKKVQN